MTCVFSLVNTSLSVEILTSPQFISWLVVGSSTMNLSLGERPVLSPVSVTKAPSDVRNPSFLSTAKSINEMLSKFQ